MESIFDLVYEELPLVSKSFDDEALVIAREKFYEAVDRLKKEKTIKSTLEVEIAGAVEKFAIDDSKDLEDWFVVSALTPQSKGEEIASFEVDGTTYTIHKATQAKCPRCWRYASVDEESACPRCAEVV